MSIVSPARIQRVFDIFIANKSLYEVKQPIAARRSKFNSYTVFFNNLDEKAVTLEQVYAEYYKHHVKDESKDPLTLPELLALAKKDQKECAKGYNAEQIDELLKRISSHKIRFNKKIFTAIASTADLIIEELTRHTISQAILAEKKNLKEKFTFSEGIESISTFPLLRDLPSWGHVIEDKKKDDEADSEDVDEMGCEKVFFTYIGKMFSALKDDYTDFGKLSISNTYKTVVNRLLVEFCNKLFNISYIIIRTRNQKTITMEIIKSALMICVSMNIFGESKINADYETTYAFEENENFKAFSKIFEEEEKKCELKKVEKTAKSPKKPEPKPKKEAQRGRGRAKKR